MKVGKRILEVVIVSIITFVVNVTWLYCNLDTGRIEVTQALNENNEYNVVVAIRNFKTYEYLNNIIIDISDEIAIKDVVLCNDIVACDENSFVIDKLAPDNVTMINFSTPNKITGDKIKFIGNGETIRVKCLNEEDVVESKVFIILGIGILIFAVMLFISFMCTDRNLNKILEYYEKEKALASETKKILEKEVTDISEKQENIQELLLYSYIEIKDLTKENHYYRDLLKNILKDNERKSFKNLEKKITNSLKTYTTDDGMEETYEKLKFISKKIQELDKKEN